MLHGNAGTDVSKKQSSSMQMAQNGAQYGGKNSEKCEDEVLKWTGTKPFLHVQLS